MDKRISYNLRLVNLLSKNQKKTKNEEEKG
jgi:hypothetical protein